MLPCHKNSLAFARGVALLVALGLGFILVPEVSRADDTLTHHLKDNMFVIPYAIDANQSLKQLRLFVSTDRKTFSPTGSTALRKGVFSYTAAADGEYTFVVQLEDANGNLSPPNPDIAKPTMRVIVDTQKPQVTLRAVQPKEGRVAVAWEIVDANTNLRTLRLEAKGPGEVNWTPLNVTPLQAAQFGWNPPGGGPIEVRLSVKDLAGNEATATTQVTPTPGAAPAAGVGDDRQVIFVKQKKFRLTYKVDGAGLSKVKHVEVWATRNRSEWHKFGTAPEVGPHEITVLTTGRYGFTLRPISGVNRGRPEPRGGDNPQIWVEVDETPPVVRFNNFHVGENADSGKVIVNWIATDKFMKDQPITILYSKTGTGEWNILQDNLENTGTAKVTPPEKEFEFFVKIEAVDKAGNKGSAQSREAIKVDLKIPEVTDVGAAGIEVTPSAQPPGQ